MTIEQITEILAKYDPLGLIQDGAPLDEYRPEAELIIHAVENRPTLPHFVDLSTNIHNIFVKMFGIKFKSITPFDDIAKEIIKVKMEE